MECFGFPQINLLWFSTQKLHFVVGLWFPFNTVHGFALFLCYKPSNQVSLHHFYIINRTWSIKYTVKKSKRNAIGSFGVFFHHHAIASFFGGGSFISEIKTKKNEKFFPSLFMWISSVHLSKPFCWYLTFMNGVVRCLSRGVAALGNPASLVSHKRE